MMTPRAAIYCRISKDKVGAGIGAARQEADCRELAERLDWTVAEVFTDNDISAYSGKRRPAYQAMLEAIRSGAVDAVLAWHTDRLHRSPVELETFIAACEPRSVPTHCVKAGPLDLATPSGRLVARQLGAVARYESEHMAERIQAQKARAAAAGQWIGGARPFGYTRDGAALEPAEADAILDGVRRVLAGESVYAITKSWQGTVPAARGGIWHAQNVRRVLTRPRNAGLATHRGEVVGAGSWPAIITEDEHHAVCAILSDPARTTYSGVRSLKWIGSGLYRCGRCSADLRSASNMTRDGRTRRVYRCRSGMHLMINGGALDEFIVETVCTLLDEHGAGLLPDRDAEATRDLHEQANTLRARLDELADAYGDGDIDRRQYTRQRERITAKLDTVTSQLASAGTGGVLDGIATAEKPFGGVPGAAGCPAARHCGRVDDGHGHRGQTRTATQGHRVRLRPRAHRAEGGRVRSDPLAAIRAQMARVLDGVRNLGAATVASAFGQQPTTIADMLSPSAEALRSIGEQRAAAEQTAAALAALPKRTLRELTVTTVRCPGNKLLVKVVRIPSDWPGAVYDDCIVIPAHRVTYALEGGSCVQAPARFLGEHEDTISVQCKCHPETPLSAGQLLGESPPPPGIRVLKS